MRGLRGAQGGLDNARRAHAGHMDEAVGPLQSGSAWGAVLLQHPPRTPPAPQKLWMTEQQWRPTEAAGPTHSNFHSQTTPLPHSEPTISGGPCAMGASRQYGMSARQYGTSSRRSYPGRRVVTAPESQAPPQGLPYNHKVRILSSLPTSADTQS